MTPAKGEKAPQTVESLQEIMAKDAEVFRGVCLELSGAKSKINQLQQMLARCRQQCHELQRKGAV